MIFISLTIMSVLAIGGLIILIHELVKDNRKTSKTMRKSKIDIKKLDMLERRIKDKDLTYMGIPLFRSYNIKIER